MMILRTLLAEFKQLPAEIGYILGWARGHTRSSNRYRIRYFICWPRP